MFNHTLKDQYVEVGNVRTRYWALGGGPSSIILLHGIGGYIENWKHNIEALTQICRVYALDIVGFGRTDKPDIKFTIPYLAEFVHEFMIALDIDKAGLIGESMGGGIALKLAIKYPQQVEKLVLVDSVGLGKEVSTTFRMMSLPILGELITRPSRKGSTQLLQVLFHDQGLITDQQIEESFGMSSLPGAQRCLLSVLRCGCNIWGARSDAYRPILDHLGEVKKPTLILWGAQDRILPSELAHRAVKGLPNAQLHIIDPCGHIPNLECPQKFNALVTDFLSKG